MSYKIGFMGCGVVADYGHAHAVRETPGVHIHALFDPDADRLAWFRDRHAPEALTFTDQEAFLDSGLDAVAVLSPAPFHKANVLAAAKRRLPVMCEKPLAMSVDEGAEMIAAMDAAGAPLAAGFCYRYSPSAMEIKRLVEDGAIGDVRSLRLIYNWDCHGKYYRPDPQARPDHWTVDPRRLGRMREGGPMVDCGTHQIDLAMWWLDSPVTRTTGHAAWVDEYDAPDHAFAHLDHANGAHTMVEMSFSYGHTTRDKFSRFEYELIGTSGIILYDRNAEIFELRTDQFTRRLDYHWEKSFHGLWAAYRDMLDQPDRVATLRSSQCPLSTAENAMEVTRIAWEATQHAIDTRSDASRWPDRLADSPVSAVGGVPAPPEDEAAHAEQRERSLRHSG
ncbi:MAG: Gfo/Idh/MocA family oxidoreductase [Planctomycetota bacterium]